MRGANFTRALLFAGFQAAAFGVGVSLPLPGLAGSLACLVFAVLGLACAINLIWRPR